MTLLEAIMAVLNAISGFLSSPGAVFTYSMAVAAFGVGLIVGSFHSESWGGRIVGFMLGVSVLIFSVALGVWATSSASPFEWVTK